MTATKVLKNTLRNKNLEFVSSLILQSRYVLTYSETKKETKDAIITEDKWPIT